MENYKDYLQTLTGLTLAVRPMSYSEADSIISYSWAYNQSYWLGSENLNGGGVWNVNYGGNLGNDYIYHGYGVRPVIEISASAF